MDHANHAWEWAILCHKGAQGASAGWNQPNRAMLLGPGSGVLPRRQLEQHLLDPLGREILLGERHAAVEGLRIAGDQAVLEPEERNALEYDRFAFGAGHARGIAEAVSRIARAGVAHRVEEVPAVVR